MQNKKIKVILLVAGEGKRLRPYTLDRPKCMVEIEGKSLIERQLEVLKNEGLNDVVMIGGYNCEMLKKYGYKIIENSRYFETNMLWTLFCAEGELEGDVIVSYGDIVYSKRVIKALLDSNSDIAVTIDKDWESYWRSRNEDPLDDAETLKIRKDGTISEIGQKPKSLDEIEGQYMGLMKFSDRGLKQIKEIFHSSIKDINILGKDAENAYMTDLLQAAIVQNNKVMAVPVFGEWIEVDTVSDLQSTTTKKRIQLTEI
jgi:L-glutamine-phosphate cytidylyltransferase